MTETTDARKRRLEGERVAGDAVAEVLAAHERLSYRDEPYVCSCDPGTQDGTRSWQAHVAALIAPLLDQARAEGAAEVRARVLARVDSWPTHSNDEPPGRFTEYRQAVTQCSNAIRAVLADADNEAVDRG